MRWGSSVKVTRTSIPNSERSSEVQYSYQSDPSYTRFDWPWWSVPSRLPGSSVRYFSATRSPRSSGYRPRSALYRSRAAMTGSSRCLRLSSSACRYASRDTFETTAPPLVRGTDPPPSVYTALDRSHTWEHVRANEVAL